MTSRLFGTDGLLAGQQLLRIMRETGKKIIRARRSTATFSANFDKRYRRDEETLRNSAGRYGCGGGRRKNSREPRAGAAPVFRHGPLARVMVEGEDDGVVRALAASIASTIETELR